MTFNEIRTNELPWFALHVRHRWEQKAADLLSEKGYEQFAPSYQVVRRWSDRRKVFQEPLFPGYIFCRMTEGAQGKILTTPGVLDFVGCAGRPLPVETREIESLKQFIASGQNLTRHPYLVAGDIIRIISGPLAGLEGIFVESTTSCQIVVSVTLLQRSVAVEINPSWALAKNRRERLPNRHPMHLRAS